MNEIYEAIRLSGISLGIFDEQTPLVFGEGKAGSQMMLVGEAPGAQEVMEGKPFVGKAGKNLSSLLLSIGIVREEVFVSNVVKLRPTAISKVGNIINRPPNNMEKQFFTPWLHRETLYLKPKAIISLGNVALNAYMDSISIGEAHGKWQDIRVEYEGETFKTKLFPLYHPAAIIYNRALIEVYNQDLQKLKMSLEI